MKRLILFLLIASLVGVFVMAGPALAASLGMSPSKVDVTVPADGSRRVDMTAYYYTGDVEITLENIPLTVTPETIHVEAADNPQPFSFTIHGDPSLGSRIYDGYIRFQGMSGEMIAIAVKVKARVTNLVAGEEPVLVTPTAPAAAPSEAAISPSTQLDEVAAPGNANIPPPQNTPSSSDIFAGLSLNTIIIIAGGLVFLGLVILALSLAVRRRTH
jgi:hypothetical protein